MFVFEQNHVCLKHLCCSEIADILLTCVSNVQHQIQALWVYGLFMLN